MRTQLSEFRANSQLKKEYKLYKSYFKSAGRCNKTLSILFEYKKNYFIDDSFHWLLNQLIISEIPEESKDIIFDLAQQAALELDKRNIKRLKQEYKKDTSLVNTFLKYTQTAELINKYKSLIITNIEEIDLDSQGIDYKKNTYTAGKLLFIKKEGLEFDFHVMENVPDSLLPAGIDEVSAILVIGPEVEIKSCSYIDNSDGYLCSRIFYFIDYRNRTLMFSKELTNYPPTVKEGFSDYHAPDPYDVIDYGNFIVNPDSINKYQ